MVPVHREWRFHYNAFLALRDILEDVEKASERDMHVMNETCMRRNMLLNINFETPFKTLGQLTRKMRFNMISCCQCVILLDNKPVAKNHC